MKQIITKTIYGGRGMLYVSCGDTAYNMARCISKIECIEDIEQIDRLGSGEIVLRKHADAVLTFDAGAPENFVPLNKVDSFGVTMPITRKDGKIEMMDFPRCRLISTLDLIDGGVSTFEIECSDETLEKLRRM